MKRTKRWLCLVLVTMLMVTMCMGPVAAEEMGLTDAMPNINDVKILDVQTRSHSLALDYNGNVWAWGYNTYGQWGAGFTGNAPAYTHVMVQNLSNVIQIAVGSETSYALRADGTVWAWGDNSKGYQLGNGTQDQLSTLPTQVLGLNNVKEISAGSLGCLALVEDGTVWAWGNNTYGQLGDGSTTHRNVPVQVVGLDEVKAISSGGSFSMALKEDGTVWAWGHNETGSLGIGSTTSQNTPVQVQRLLKIKQISAGSDHGGALKDDGTVWTWGRNYDGQVGDGSKTNRLIPVQLNLANINHVVAGGDRTFAFAENGTWWGWGNNAYGQLCSEDQVSRLEPTQISLAMSNILSTDGRSTVFFKEDGSIWGCGQNNAGQLRMDKPFAYFISPIVLFGPGSYVGPGIDPPDPTQHTITIIERYADGTPDKTTTHNINDGDPFSTTYHSTGTIQSFEVSAADARVRADYAARFLEIDRVDRDITVTLTFDAGGGAPDPGDVTLTNMVQAADYADLSLWNLSPDNATMQAGGDALTMTIHTADSMYYQTLRQDMQMDISHQYYVRSHMYFDEATFPGATTLEVRLQLGNNSLESVRASGWTEISTIGSPSHQGTNRFQQLYRFGPTAGYQGGVMKSREPLVIDLTAAFGAGNEPTVAWCDANIPFFTGTTTVAAPPAFAPASARDQAARAAELQLDADEPIAPEPEPVPDPDSEPELDMQEPEDPEPIPAPESDTEPEPEPESEPEPEPAE